LLHELNSTMLTFCSRVEVCFIQVNSLTFWMSQKLVSSCRSKVHLFFTEILLSMWNLVSYPSQKSSDLDQTSHMLTAATRELFNELDKSVKPVAPMQFWMVCAPLLPYLRHFLMCAIWESFSNINGMNSY